MENTYGRLFYTNFYSEYSNNTLDTLLSYSIDYVLRNDSFMIKEYLKDLKSKYKFNSYMYIFESVGNYLANIYNNLYEDYLNGDKAAERSLYGIRKKYYCIMFFYEQCLDEEIERKLHKENSKIINHDFSKKNRFGIKRKIYTNDLKKEAR